MNPRPKSELQHTGPSVLLYFSAGTREESADRLDHNRDTISTYLGNVKAFKQASDEYTSGHAGIGVSPARSSRCRVRPARAPGAGPPHHRPDSGFQSLDPIFVSGVGGQELASLIYSYLVKFNDRGELVPDAAVAVPTVPTAESAPTARRSSTICGPACAFLTAAPSPRTTLLRQSATWPFPDLMHPRAWLSTTSPPSRRRMADRQGVLAPTVCADRALLCGPGNAVPLCRRRSSQGHAHMRGTRMDTNPLGSGP